MRDLKLKKKITISNKMNMIKINRTYKIKEKNGIEKNKVYKMKIICCKKITKIYKLNIKIYKKKVIMQTKHFTKL